MNSSIKIIDAVKTFDKKRILDDITVSFDSSSIHGIKGRNGSGKTVLLKAICGFITLTSGSILISGKEIGKDMDFPNNIGVVLESAGFIPYESGYANLKHLASIRNEIGDEEICKAMIMVGLDPKEKKHVSKYSLGMKQRLGIAQAIMENPDIVILDEPTNGIDSEGVDQMHKMLLKLKEEGKLIIIVSHNSDDISLLCDRVYRMEHGKLKEE